MSDGVKITHEPIPGFPPAAAEPRDLALAELQAAYALARDNAADGVAQEAFRAAYAAFYEQYLKE